jgi:hypothetical protein
MAVVSPLRPRRSIPGPDGRTIRGRIERGHAYMMHPGCRMLRVLDVPAGGFAGRTVSPSWRPARWLRATRRGGRAAQHSFDRKESFA